MHLLNSIKQSGYTILIIITACIFSFLFSAVSINSAFEQEKGLQILITHPFKVSASIYNIRNALSEMQIRVGRLASYNTIDDIQFVEENMIKSALSIENDINYILTYYLGPKEEPRRVAEILQQYYDAQNMIIQNATTVTPIMLAAAIDTHLSPLYKEINSIFTNKMLVYIDNTGKRLSAQSTKTLKQNFLLSISISLLMILLAFAAQHVITIRKKEKAYRDDVLKIISENTDNVFMLYNSKLKYFEYISPNVATLMGITKKSLDAKPKKLIDYFNNDHTEHLTQLLEKGNLSGYTSDECFFKNPQTGNEGWMHVRIYPVQEQGNTIIRHILSISDLTEIKKTQEVLKDALVNAQNANEAKSQFFSRMSHDIRTPMNAIIGMTTIAATALNDKARIEDCLVKIASSSRHLLMLINDVLDMSKIESGKLALAQNSFDFSEFIRSLVTIIYPQASAKNQDFEMSLGNVTHETLIGDSLRLNQVLINILSNAIKFTPEGGHIKMTVKEHFDPQHKDKLWLYFTITDDGIGMQADFLERLFLPFEQENTKSTKTVHGTGLGMAIAKNIVSLMQGTIDVRSTPGQGTIFDVGLSFEIPETEIHHPSVESVELDKLNVLIVDDDIDTCEHTAIILHRIGVKAEWVLSGNVALTRIMDTIHTPEHFDVVFIDWKMPEMDGIELTKRVRQHVGPETLIIIISSYDWTEIEYEARKAGANGFIPKPMFQSAVYNTLLSVTKGITPQTNQENAPPCYAGKRFLLVEDNEINSEIAMEFLKITEASIDIVENGAKAVELFEKSAPSTYALILMDVQMPVMNGYNATRAIRKLSHPDASNTPILAMTADAFADDVATALQSGMNDHISKPIDIEVLYQKIKKWLPETTRKVS